MGKKIKTEPVDLEDSIANQTIIDASAVIKEEESYEDKLKYCNEIAKPMASKKVSKKCMKLVKKAMKHKTYLRKGLKDVQMRLRKGETGVVIFAGDVRPVEMMCHLPAVCEEKGVPYIYIPSRRDLGEALGVRRGMVLSMVREHPEYKDLYDEVITEIGNCGLPF